MSKKDSLGTDIGKLAVKGLKKLGVKAKKEKKVPSRDVGKKGGVLGSGAAQKAHDALKNRNKKTTSTINSISGGKERKEMKGRR